jgi:hypothetical protein
MVYLSQIYGNYEYSVKMYVYNVKMDEIITVNKLTFVSNVKTVIGHTI